MITGVGAKKVMRLIEDRLGGIAPKGGARRLGLVVEGGAMRGTYTAGSLLGLHLMEANGIFDLVMATSAGAVNAAHFLSGVGHLQAATYYRALADGRFFKPWRLPRPLDVDFLIDFVLRKEMPLDMGSIARANTPFKVALLNCETGRGEMRLLVGDDLSWEILRAAVAIPVVYNRRVPLPGGTFVDGGVAIPYPLLEAIAEGMTDLVVLLGRNPLNVTPARSSLQYFLWSSIFAKGHRRLRSLFGEFFPRLRKLDRMVSGVEPAPANVNILAICPTIPAFSTAGQNRHLLREGLLEMAKETLQVFGRDAEPLQALIREGIV